MKHLFVILIIIIFCLESCQNVYKSEKNDHSVNSNGLDTLYTITLGGMDQWIQVISQDTSNPILLYLHGGPGSTETPQVRYFNFDLTEYFSIVTWDQRGAGKSYNADIPTESMTFDQFLTDTYDLIIYLKKEFKKEKIYLVGHSWGAALGLSTAINHPNDLYAYIGIGQLVNFKRNEQYSYEFTMKKAAELNDSLAIEFLSQAGEPFKRDNDFTRNYLLKQRELVLKYGGIFYDSTIIEKYGQGFEMYKDYQKLEYFEASEFSLRFLMDDLIQIDFFNSNEVEIPVYFVMGKYDNTTPTPLLKEFYKILDAPKKQLFIFNESAHFPNFEEPKKFSEIMIKILKETYESNTTAQQLLKMNAK